MFSLDLIWLNRLVMKLLLGPFLGKPIPFVWFEKLVPEINCQWLTHLTFQKGLETRIRANLFGKSLILGLGNDQVLEVS